MVLAAFLHTPQKYASACKVGVHGSTPHWIKDHVANSHGDSGDLCDSITRYLGLRIRYI